MGSVGDASRFVYDDEIFPDLIRQFKVHQSTLWTTEELDLAEDKREFETLDGRVQHLIKTVLAFFAFADGVVNENIGNNFYVEVPLPPARAFYAVQMLIETIHAETYSALLKTIVADRDEVRALKKTCETNPVIVAKAEWMKRFMHPDVPLVERLIAFAAVEGIFFSASFCVLFWLRTKGSMKGLTKSNEFIARDEGLHRDFAINLVNLIRREQSKPSVPEYADWFASLEMPSDERVVEIVKMATQVEQLFVKTAFDAVDPDRRGSVTLTGISEDAMGQYVEFVADHLLQSLGLPRHFGSSNPFDFMDMISIDGKTNFFEQRVSEYARASSVGDRHIGDPDEDDDF